MIVDIRKEEIRENKNLTQILNLEEELNSMATKKQKYIEKIKILEEREKKISLQVENLKRSSSENLNTEEQIVIFIYFYFFSDIFIYQKKVKKSLETERERFSTQLHLSSSLQKFFSNTNIHMNQLFSKEAIVQKELLKEYTNFLFQSRVELQEILNLPEIQITKEMKFKFHMIKDKIESLKPVLSLLTKVFEGKGEPLFEGIKVILKHISQMILI
jgi:hypothetical protein